MERAFIFTHAPFPSAHASSIAETRWGLVAAWFGGTREGHSDVRIWIARHEGMHWSPPEPVADGRTGRFRRFPCWNPVLFQVAHGPLLLFYKVGPSPSRWWGMLIQSIDGGRTWSEPKRLPKQILGPIKNKPVPLRDGTLLCPSSSEDQGWRVHLERTSDLGITWHRDKPLNDRKAFAAIQPTVLSHPGDRLQLLCRSRQGAITECWSDDGGRSWSPMVVMPLPNPDSGIDAVTLGDGRALLIYNHAQMGRSPLNLALSEDGVHWNGVASLEDEPGGEFSYPAIIQGADGRVHMTWTWNRRRIRYACLDPFGLSPLGPIVDGHWPEG
jgi:predicted neuraminidase